MCNICNIAIAKVAKRHKLKRSVVVDILWNATNFPFGEASTYEEQLEKALFKPKNIKPKTQ